MLRKIKHLLIPSVIGLGILNFSINALADSINLSNKSEVSNANYVVEFSVPSKVTLPFGLEETEKSTNLTVTNSSLLPVSLRNVNVQEGKYWNLVGREQYIGKDVREASITLQDKEIFVGDNEMNEYVDYESSKDLVLKVWKGVWTKAIKEEAFNFSFDYEIHRREFDLVFDSNGGEEVKNITALNDDSLVIPSSKRVGYTFLGWVDSKGVVYQPGDSYFMPVGGETLTAKWEANKDTKYVVNHYQMNLDGVNFTLESTDNKTGTTDSELDVSKLSKSYEGFSYQDCKVDDSVVEKTTIKPDGSLVIDLYYSRNKYLLNISGWLDGQYSPGTDNSNGVYGRADVYINGVLSSEGCVDFYTEVFYGSSYEIKNVVSNPGRQFNGYKIGNFNDSEWVSNKGIIGTSGNQVLLDFSTITYSINYDLNGGSVLGNPSMFNVDTNTFTLSNPVKTGYTFLGWTGSNGTVPSTSVTINKGSIGNKSYVANWKANTYSVVFNSNGGSGSMPNQIHTYDSTLELTRNSFSRVGYNFVGWNTQADGSGVNYSNGQSVSNLASSQGAVVNLYARWSVIDYSITYNLNGGTNPSNAPSKYNVETSTITLPTPIKVGHTFVGWFDNSSLTGNAITQIPIGSVGNKIFYAKWSVNSYYLDVSGYLDSEGSTNVAGYGTFDVYINGELVAQGASDYYKQIPYGTSYEIKNIQSTVGHNYVGVHSGSLKGTVNVGDNVIRLSFNTNTYKVVYNSNGGSGTTSTSTHKYGEAKNLTANGFSKVGYSFAGWATSASGPVVYSNGQSVTSLTSTNNGTVNLYAKWTPNTNTKYVVRHHQMNLDGVNYTLVETENKTGTSDSSLTVSNLKKTYTGFTYVNGKVGSSVVTTTTVAPDGSRVIDLYYSRNLYGFDLNGYIDGYVMGSLKNSSGSVFAKVDVYINGIKVGDQVSDFTSDLANFYYGSTWEIKNITVSAGRQYNGLYAQTEVTSAKELKGVIGTNNTIVCLNLSTINYSITYNLNGGSMTGQKTSYNVDTPTFTLPTPSRTGYLFSGWTGSNGSTPQTSVSVSKGSTGNKSYTANWTPKKLTTTFYRNLNSSDTTTAQQVFTYGTSGQAFTNKNWTKTGYTQLGWSDSRTATTQQYSTLSGVADSWIESKYPSNNIYAVWKPNTYTIAFKTTASGASGTTPNITATYDNSYTLTTNGFSRPGYTFAGWNTKEDGSGVSYTDKQSVKNLTSTNGGVVNLYAQWKANSYTLTFNPNGGSVSTTSKTLSYGSQYGDLPTPSRNGYTFTGWYTAASGGTKVSSTTTIGAGNVTVYAQWTPTNYSITYNLNGGTNPSGVATSYNITSSAITLPTPSRTGYSFGGWYTSSALSGTAVTSIASGSTGNKVFYAKWTPVTYSISYNLNGGSVVGNPSMYNIETATFTLSNPVRTGYTFTGWTGSNGSTAQTNVSIAKGSTGNKSYTANWRANTYTVSYNGNGSTSGSTASSIHTYGVAKTLTSNGFARTGYTFKGWNTKADGSGTSYSNAQSVSNLASANGSTVTLYAQWTANTYTYNITYKSASGKSLGTSTIAGTYGSSKSVSAPAKTGYNTPSAQTVTFDSVNAKTITFTYSLVSYSITYNLNGGSVSGNPTSYNIESASITLKNPSKTGNSFTGWTGSNGSTVQTSVSIPSGSTGNKSYTANWKVNSYTATFNGNGGSNGTSITKAYGSQLGTLPTSSRTGYTFKGWFTASSGGTQITSTTTMPASNVTYYAQWTVNSYTLTFNANGGSTPTSSKSVVYGSTYGTLPTPTRTGYTFKGWFTSASGGTQVSSSTTMGASNTTVYAQWTAISYTITYNLNGGTNSSSNPKTYTVASSTINLANPSRTGYTFGGWYTESSFSNKVTSIASGSTGNKTFYAKWIANTYTIQFSANGGSGSMSNLSMTYGTSKSLTKNSFSRNGYQFLGWSTSRTATSASYSDGQSVSNLTSTNGGTVTLYAVWKFLGGNGTVTFNLNGGAYYDYLDRTENLDVRMFNGISNGYASYEWDSDYGEYRYNIYGDYGSDTMLRLGLAINNPEPGIYFLEGPFTMLSQYNFTASKFFLYDSGPDSSKLYTTRTLLNDWSAYGVAFEVRDESFTSDLQLMLSFSSSDASGRISTPSFKLHKCSTGTTSTKVTNGKFTYPFESVVKEGYGFDGWYTAPTGGSKVNISEINGNVTVYAHWTKLTGNTYSIEDNLFDNLIDNTDKDVSSDNNMENDLYKPSINSVDQNQSIDETITKPNTDDNNVQYDSVIHDNSVQDVIINQDGNDIGDGLEDYLINDSEEVLDVTIEQDVGVSDLPNSDSIKDNNSPYEDPPDEYSLNDDSYYIQEIGGDPVILSDSVDLKH